MEKIVQALEEIQEMNNVYGISNDLASKTLDEMEYAKVCTPVIGKFSSGKSALVNTILGYNGKLLKENITPETAVPAEIVYSEAEESVIVLENDGQSKEISLGEFRDYEADASKVKSVRLNLSNSFLEEIPDVMLVDMPGFESGYEVHNKAIDNYLPQSLAYIIAFPADDMIVRSSVGNILRELCLNDMPLCVVITKYDKRNDEFEMTFQKMKESLKRYVGERSIHYCRTSSFEGEVEELEEFLKEIQKESQQILAGKFAGAAKGIMENTENYLKTLLANSQLSESELAEQEEKLQRQLQGMETKFSREQGDFQLEISSCVQEIQDDVQRAMEAEESTLITMAMNNQSINEHLNNVVRRAVTVSVKKRFLSKVEKYLKRVAKCMNEESFGDVHISFHYDTENLGQGITSSVVAVAAGILLGLPILGVVAAIAMKFFGNRKREEAKQEIRRKLQSEVFPEVLSEVGSGIEAAITEQMKLVNTSIEEEIKTQRETIEKAMSDVREQIEDENTRKEGLAADIERDLERIGGLKDGL